MLKMMIFSDFHYRKRMYTPQVKHLEEIMNRAAEEKVDLVIHAGDLSNDYLGSPELIKAYIDNPQGLPVYGVYGNHDIERATMKDITPLLCNREVNFPSDDVGYWYSDIQGNYRLIGLDTNYSYSEEKGIWEHNYPASWGPPAGNKLGNSLAPEQIAWFESVIADASEKKLKVILISHSAMGGNCNQSPDAAAVREIFAKYPKTVILAISGHMHTNHFDIFDNIVYFDVNTTFNACWHVEKEYHYADDHTFEYHEYDKDGNETAVFDMKINDLHHGKNTWFLKDPLYGILTIEDDGTFKLEGKKTEWLYGIEPPYTYNGMMPEISTKNLKIEF